ncbi:hypothetical protein N0Y54_18665 [Nostoc punctiforme UO1]|uniref:hypothetical protein n=1 Tax=Nostoc punctiforme TaxID=272131 RepID=UPI0030B49690
MDEDLPGMNVEILHHFFQGGEKDGNSLHQKDVSNILADALRTILYQTLSPQLTPRKADCTYLDNASFWKDALSNKHFPGANIVLEDFHLMEWLPFSPGRYFTHEAMFQRERAVRAISMDRNEYLPEGKSSMVRGGIGAIRLAEKNIDGNIIYFLGASSTGIAHQGIPIALPLEEYRKVMPTIKEYGGCRVKLVGYLQTMIEKLPSLHYDTNVPRYCLFIEEVAFKKASMPDELLTTVATMFTAKKQTYGDTEKSWTFCSFNPSSSKHNAKTAAEWLLDYAIRYSQDEPTILTDFDEHCHLFPCRVEFPISDIVSGKVDWQTLRVYKQRLGLTYIIEEYINIGTYIKENIKVEGD